MNSLNTQKIFRILVSISIIIILFVFTILISINFIVDPIIYWLASTEKARIFIACIISLLINRILFELFYKYYIYRKRKTKFNAMKIPYHRKFKGRKFKGK